MAQEVREIKVLSVSHNDYGGGAANAAIRIQQGVNRMADEVHSRMIVKDKRTTSKYVISVSSFLPHNRLFRVFDWLVAKVKNQIQHARWNRYPNRSSLFMSDARGMWINGALQKQEYDILHLHWINKRFINLRDIPRNKPIVWTLHDSWPFTGVCHVPYDCSGYEKACGSCPMLASQDPGDLSHKVWQKKAAAYRDLNLHIVTPSRWLADCAKRSSLFRDLDIRVIPNCLDTDVFCPMNRDEACELLGLDSTKRYILYGAVNALSDKNKGFAYLQQAIESLQWESDVEIILFGTHGHTFSFSNIPCHCFSYLGGKKLVAAYNVASVMVVPSMSEVFGQTASEAMACGTPVVAFRCTGIQDVVGQDGGYLAEPYSVEDLAHGIELVLEHNRHGEMCDMVRKSAVERFSIPLVAKQYVELYKELAGKG